VQDILAKAILQHKISHAWLLTGPSLNVREEAMDFAKALLCHAPVNGQACNHCPACHKADDGNHVDLQILEPHAGKAKSVTIEQTRQMQHLAGLESYEGGRQVVIIHDAHTMQLAAANSLLKILEEPPENLVFILTAQNGDSLLPTILSRCSWVKVGGQEEVQETAAVMAELAVQFFTGLDQMPDSKVLLFADQLREDRTGVEVFLQQLLILLRDGAVCHWVPQATVLCCHRPQCLPFSGRECLQAARLVEEGLSQWKANVNSKLLLDVLLLKLAALARKDRH